MSRLLYIIGVAVQLLFCLSCSKIDDNMLPSYPVYINLSTPGYWDTYGVVSPGMYRIFNKNEGVPTNYPYNANIYTGYGGVLLVCDLFENAPRAYDMSCPVERRADVRISVDSSNYEAVCAKCGSRYDVMSGWGAPLDGKALSQKIGLTRYSVVKTGSGYNVVN